MTFLKKKNILCLLNYIWNDTEILTVNANRKTKCNFTHFVSLKLIKNKFTQTFRTQYNEMHIIHYIPIYNHLTISKANNSFNMNSHIKIPSTYKMNVHLREMRKPLYFLNKIK